jgi:PAS domain S-box-containing protein
MTSPLVWGKQKRPESSVTTLSLPTNVRARPAESRRGHTAATHLAIYGVAIILPLLIAFGLLLYHTVQSEREQLHERMVQTLDDLHNDINRDISRSITLLHTLASSPLLQKQDWAAFHQQSIAALPGTSHYIVLIDTSGHQIVNSYVPYGKAPALTGDPETLRRVLAARQPVVSDLFTSLVVKAPVYNVSVPVFQDGEVRYVLSLGCLPDEIEQILRDQTMPPEWVTTVWDRNGVIVARSRDMDAFAGVVVPESLRPPSRPGPRVRNADGEEVLRTSLISDRSGWGIAVSVSADAAEQRLTTLVYYWLGITAIAAVATLYLAIVFGRTLTGPLSAVAAATAALARGEKVRIENSRLREVDGLAHLLADVQQELDEQKRDLAESERRMRAFLENSAVVAWLQDEQGRYVFLSENYQRRFGGDRLGTVDREHWPPQFARAFAEDDADAWAQEESVEVIETVVTRDGESSTWLSNKFTYADPAGNRFVGSLGVDITNLKRAEEHRTLLINELNHRVKNVIATVQAIAAQTFRSGTTSAAAVATFQSRLVALATAHDLLTRENWEGADLRDVVDQSVAPHAGQLRPRIEVHGPSVRLAPKASLAIAMALNELCTNSAKYGALSSESGVLTITWTIAEAGARRSVSLQWRESGGPPVRKPVHRGFGTVLIERMLAHDLDGTVQLSFEPAGVTCRIDFPL